MILQRKIKLLFVFENFYEWLENLENTHIVSFLYKKLSKKRHFTMGLIISVLSVNC